ncbi:hypothetical protein MtrunA17_Chr4g0048441 [Medicago truncatula]|jgi:hypothetical protein|uniref:Uncharacterized protein n=1 Tax=Medicago truncatula TaxID=3880 RepID=A0A396IA89_MEDTR|nr:hypothetical protein MtrunA17_Chr4g0048441 [Medicago truncatula]
MDGKPSLYEMTLPVVSFQVTCRAPATRMGWLAKLAPGQEWLVEERYNLCSIILFPLIYHSQTGGREKRIAKKDP